MKRIYGKNAVSTRLSGTLFNETGGLKQPHQTGKALHHLTMTVLYIDSDLRNQRVCSGELSEGINSDGKLTDTHDPDSEL